MRRLRVSFANEKVLDIHGHSDVSQRPTGSSILSDTALVTAHSDYNVNRKGKPRFAQLLNRSWSIRVEDNSTRAKPPSPIRTVVREGHGRLEVEEESALRSAPLHEKKDYSVRDRVGSNMRNRSADRQPASKQTMPINTNNRHERETPGLASSQTGSLREHTGVNLFANIKSTSNQATDGLRKAGKGFFGKITRSGSSNSREPADDEPYVFTTINLPLVEQTRRTRIAKRLEDSKDKTEFWMPALPWRCIE